MIAYLLGVVVLPLVALASVLLVQVRDLEGTNDAARRFQREVARGTAWVELRVAVQNERLFVEALATSKEFGVPVSLVTTLTGVDFEAEAALARMRTDEALARVDLLDTSVELAEPEQARADGASRETVRMAFNALEQEGSEQVTSLHATVRAASAGLPLAHGVFSDLDALWGFEGYSSQIRRQLNALFTYLSATSPDQRQDAHDRLVIAEAAALDIRNDLAITSPTWARQLDEVEGRPSVRLIEQQIDDTLAAPASDTMDLDSLRELGQLFLAFEERHDAINELFTSAGDAVRTEAARIGDDAARSSRRWTLIGTAVLVTSVALAAAAAMLIRSPLRRLEEIANDLARGHLETPLDVQSGPREVGVVGAALNQAIESLRAVAERADQLIGGHGIGPETDGQRASASAPLGEAIEATLVTLERSWQQQAELQAQLAHAATHDSLTGLTNRSALSRHLDALRSGTLAAPKPHGILFIDLDGFKDVNDQLGHAAGDTVLVEAADRLQRVCRGSDVVARIGGDEFVVVVSESTCCEALGHIADRILATLSQPYSVAGTVVAVGASIGVAISDGSSDTRESLGKADAALYRAKAQGRGRIEFEDCRPPAADLR